MRSFILILYFFAFILLSFTMLGQKKYLYVGSYSDNDSTGIYVLEFDCNTGNISEVKHKYKISNPSFLAISNNKSNLYAISENSIGTVSSFKIDHDSGALLWLNTQQSKGSGPCHLVTDLNNKWCIVGHYGSGDISTLPIMPDGSLGVAEIRYNYKPNKADDPKTPRVHSINFAPNNKDMFVPDLGLDKILHFKFDSKTAKITPAYTPFYSLPEGSGPRHLSFHPSAKFVYVINEHTSTINGFSFKGGRLGSISSVVTLPDDFKDKNYCADIHISPDGKFLYGSNRGHNSIAVFSIDSSSGLLTTVGHISTKGDFPRNFVIDPTGNFLLVANQKSDNIQIFKRDTRSGLLHHLSTVENIHKPVCLKFL